MTGAFVGILCLLSFYNWVWNIYQLEHDMEQKMEQTTRIMSSLIYNQIDTAEQVLFSQIMEQLVKTSQYSEEKFQIKEAFLLGANSKVIAHSNVIFLAKSFRDKYKGKEFTKAFQQPIGSKPLLRKFAEENTITVRILAKLANIHPSLDLLSRFFTLFVPIKIASQYHASAACCFTFGKKEGSSQISIFDENILKSNTTLSNYSLHLIGRVPKKILTFYYSPLEYYKEYPFSLFIIALLYIFTVYIVIRWVQGKSGRGSYQYDISDVWPNPSPYSSPPPTPSLGNPPHTTGRNPSSKQPPQAPTPHRAPYPPHEGHTTTTADKQTVTTYQQKAPNKQDFMIQHT